MGSAYHSGSTFCDVTINNWECEVLAEYTYVLWEYIVQSAHGVWMAKTRTFYQPFYLLRLKSVSFVEKRKIASLMEISLIRMDKSNARKIPLVALFLYLYIILVLLEWHFYFDLRHTVTSVLTEAITSSSNQSEMNEKTFFSSYVYVYF